MRVNQLHIQDSKIVKEYAYQEDRNGAYRQEMEDSNDNDRKILLLKKISLAKGQGFLEFSMGMEDQRYPSIVQRNFLEY